MSNSECWIKKIHPECMQCKKNWAYFFHDSPWCEDKCRQDGSQVYSLQIVVRSGTKWWRSNYILFLKHAWTFMNLTWSGNSRSTFASDVADAALDSINAFNVKRYWSLCIALKIKVRQWNANHNVKGRVWLVCGDSSKNGVSKEAVCRMGTKVCNNLLAKTERLEHICVSFFLYCICHYGFSDSSLD